MNKDDGAMPLHFDERDIISRVLHLRNVLQGGQTCYYNGSKVDEPGEIIYQVNFVHSRLQIGFLNKVLHGVNEWNGQRCGIQLNIKKDVLKYFITFGITHYDKYRVSGYPQGPVIFF